MHSECGYFPRAHNRDRFVLPSRRRAHSAPPGQVRQYRPLPMRLVRPSRLPKRAAAGPDPRIALLQKAIQRWPPVLSASGQDARPSAEDIAATLAWVSRNTANVSTLANPANARALLDAATTNVDGKRAAASTARRHRTIIANSLDYAKELGTIDVGTNRFGY